MVRGWGMILHLFRICHQDGLKEFLVRLGCIYLEVVSEWRNSTFFPQFGSNPMLQELMVFLMSYRLEDFEWQHNNELPTSMDLLGI
ncbi:hypothetical protein CK203_103375 [Vitis vinifera]|uniref:Uncharacterized protein n=1 Tax=Vitis vinifera TaxID=29760 RepID=A0A438EJ31_VITVI|nr:hypothetical protein CK203_103375 [Vitis vinifera]